jgi:hypothetical protein
MISSSFPLWRLGGSEAYDLMTGGFLDGPKIGADRGEISMMLSRVLQAILSNFFDNRIVHDSASSNL